jgi:predicted small secreted protein
MHGCIHRCLAGVVVALSIAGCANSGRGAGGDVVSVGSSGGSGATGGGSSGAGAGSGTSSTSGGGGGGSGGPALVFTDATTGGDACQHLAVQFLPKIPLVYVLVDRSGSIFQTMSLPDGGTTNEWVPLRTATLAVVQNLQAQVAFGFGAYTGYAAGNMCPILDQVPIALNNYQPIATLYNMLGQPMFKAETPAQMSMEKVAQTLAQAAAQVDAGAGAQPGGKYILFVTDGETDFCDDGNAVCPADAVIAEIQKLNGQGIQTLILGIGSSLSNISVPVLQGFANAGVGLATTAPPSSAQGAPLSPTDVYNQCSGVPGWKALWTAAALTTGQALGTYAPPDGSVTNATVFSPSSTNVADLTNKLATALTTVKSCSFDLQGKIKVDVANASKGHVTIDGTPVAFDPANGWSMSTATQLDLAGSACQTWRTSGKDISFDFPCEIIVLLQ